MSLQKSLCAALTTHLAGARVVVPEAGRVAWQWFCDLHATRTYHFAGPNPISYQEIEAYARLQRWPLEPRHVALIRALDAVYLDHANKRAAPLPDGVKALPPVSKTPISAGVVDAMFG